MLKRISKYLDFEVLGKILAFIKPYKKSEKWNKSRWVFRQYEIWNIKLCQTLIMHMVNIGKMEENWLLHLNHPFWANDKSITKNKRNTI